jgi:hypothetical protein
MLKMAFALRLHSLSSIARNHAYIRQLSTSTSVIATPADALIDHPSNNIPEHIAAKLGTNLHLQPNHPLATIRSKIEDFWNRRHASMGAPKFECVSGLHPIVNVAQNFDDLLIKKGHVSRRPSDTYYVDNERVLRTHTSAHQSTLIGQGLNAFLATGIFCLLLVFFFFPPHSEKRKGNCIRYEDFVTKLMFGSALFAPHLSPVRFFFSNQRSPSS